MPFMGNGVFQRIMNWKNDAAAGIFVDATRTDTDTDDIAAALSNCITRDGQSTPFVALPMGGQKFTGLGNGASAGDSVNYGQVFSQPVFTGAAATAAAGLSTTNPLLLATIADVLAAAYSATLPGQPGGPITNDLTSTNGIISWKPRGIFNDPNQLAQAQATALCF